ncbi:MAG: glutamate 5-kinase [Gemmatales bacterium]|nr:MAG: glutamate 5-kinase [Gemmatales bacterium]
MIDPVRQEVIALAHTIVIKVGTNVLTDARGRLDEGRLYSLADEVQRVRQTGRKVLLVSSGAVGAGVGKLGLGRRPSDLRHLQACAAVGQGFLMHAYEQCFSRYGTHAAQILLTAGDFDNRSRYLNVRNTILTLFEWNCIPIINENDTVSVQEIRFGDNDRLAALVTNLLQAPLLIILTVVDGLYTCDPRNDQRAELIRTVTRLDANIMNMAGLGKSILGTGGMVSKLRAARIATAAGESVIVANGVRPGVIDAIFAAEPEGTLFLPQGNTLAARKRWLGYTALPKGSLHVDAGARTAVVEHGRSLLAIGITEVHGSFSKGDVVALCGPDGSEFARGLTNYSAHDLARIRGLRTEQIAETLGVVPYEEVVHRDNLALLV